MKLRVFAVLAMAAMLLTTGWVLADNVTIKGSTTVLPIAQKVAEAYMKENPKTKISISGGGSGNGIKALIERCGMVSLANGGLLKRKVGAAVVAVRRAGAVRTFDTLNHLFFHAQMIVAGSSYWNLGIGRDPGQVKDDEEGIKTMKTLGQNMAWLLKKIHG